MSSRCSGCTIAIAAVVVTLSLTSPPAAAQGAQAQSTCPLEPAEFHLCALARAKTFDPPRTSDGRPDLQGVWRGQTSGVENIEEHMATGDTGGGPSLIVDPPDRKIPYRPWAVAKRTENFEKYLDPNVPCFLSAVPRTLYTPQAYQIVQAPGFVVIIHERGHMYRIIPTDGSPHIGENIRLWQGSSRGRWEENTLVVDVTNQNARNWLDQQGNFYSDAVHVVERFTLIDADTIHYEARIEDPNVYTSPWTMVFAIRRLNQPGYEPMEEACHEGERDAQLQLSVGLKIYPGVTAQERK